MITSSQYHGGRATEAASVGYQVRGARNTRAKCSTYVNTLRVGFQQLPGRWAR